MRGKGVFNHFFWQGMLDMLGAWWDEYGWMTLAEFVFVLWESVESVIWPVLLGMLVNALGHPDERLNGVIMLLAGVYVLSGMMSMLREYVETRVNTMRSVFHDALRVRLVRRIPLVMFENAHVQQRVERVTAQLGNLASMPYTLFKGLIRLGAVVSMMLVLARLSVLLLFISLVLALLVIIPSFWHRSKRLNIWMDTSDARVKYGIFRSRIQSLGLDKGVDRRVFGYEAWLIRRMREVMQEFFSQVWRVQGVYARIRLILLLIQSLILLGGVLTTVLLVRIGRLSLGSLVTAITLLMRLPKSLSSALQGLGNVFFYAPLLAEYARLQREYPLKEGKVRVESPFEIRFENVWFRYPGMKRWVLRGVNLTIRPGEKIALVGKNGAGKTTLIKLLLGIYTPQKGKILVNNIPLDQVDKESYYAGLGVLLQHPPLPAFPVRDALQTALPHEAFDEEKARRVLQQVGLKKLVGRWDVWLHRHVEGGVGLSGGEWQLFLIARLLYRDPSLIILDEPTSSVDALHEERVFRLIMRATRATVIMVTHRLPSVRHAKRILVLNEGRIVEEGSHEELLRRDGLYARMYRAQTG